MVKYKETFYGRHTALTPAAVYTIQACIPFKCHLLSHTPYSQDLAPPPPPYNFYLLPVVLL